MSAPTAEEFFLGYKIERTIGSNHNSRVYFATSTLTGRRTALKVIMKRCGEESTVRTHEMIFPADVNPHIVHVMEIYEDANVILVVMEYLPGGELFDWISLRGAISESGIAILTMHILYGVKTLHDRDIVHRNIKPENLMVMETEMGATVKLADYYMSKTIDCDPGYIDVAYSDVCTAPEIMRGEMYGLAVDMWSVGVIVFMLLSGRRPFEEDDRDELREMASNAEYSMETKEWDIISDGAKDFVRKLLTVDPDERMTVLQALDHPWLETDREEEPVYETTVRKLHVTSMGRKLKRSMGAAKSALIFRQITGMTERSD